MAKITKNTSKNQVVKFDFFIGKCYNISILNT